MCYENVSMKVLYHNKKLNRLVKLDKGDWIDLAAAETVELKKGDFKLISLGISVQIPEGYEMHIAPRSSTYKNFGVIQANSVGVIDNSYCSDKDVLMFPAIALRDTKINFNDRICQFRLIQNQPKIFIEEVTSLNNQTRGGFGSTGVA